MLSISNSLKAAGRENYYLALAREDYYAKGAEEPGRWFGKGAEILGLIGEVTATPFRNLLQGQSADGKVALVQNAKCKDRQCGWDLKFRITETVR